MSPHLKKVNVSWSFKEQLEGKGYKINELWRIKYGQDSSEIKGKQRIK